jgi:integrase
MDALIEPAKARRRPRDVAIFLMLRYTGVRRESVATLGVQHFDGAWGLRDIRVKGGKTRDIPCRWWSCSFCRHTSRGAGQGDCYASIRPPQLKQAVSPGAKTNNKNEPVFERGLRPRNSISGGDSGAGYGLAERRKAKPPSESNQSSAPHVLVGLAEHLLGALGRLVAERPSHPALHTDGRQLTAGRQLE